MALPLNVAVIDALPTGSVVVVHDAAPEERVLVDFAVVPLKKVTVPVGDPAVPVTVAVNVTDCPWTFGLALDARPVIDSVVPAASATEPYLEPTIRIVAATIATASNAPSAFFAFSTRTAYLRTAGWTPRGLIDAAGSDPRVLPGRV